MYWAYSATRAATSESARGLALTDAFGHMLYSGPELLDGNPGLVLVEVADNLRRDKGDKMTLRRMPAIAIAVAAICCFAISGKLIAQTTQATAPTVTFAGDATATVPEAVHWVTMAPLPTARFGLGAASVNGIVYAIGGDLSWFGCVATGENDAYNPATNTWTTMAPMPTPRWNPSVAVLGGIIYAVGGSEGCYPPSLDFHA